MRAMCWTPTSCIGSLASSIWGSITDAIKEAVGQMLTWLFGWWTTTPSFDINQAIVHTTQNYVTAWIAVPIAVLSVLAAVTWGVVGGTTAWVRDVARGLLVFGITATGSIPIIAALQVWSTSVAKGLLAAVPTGDVGGRILHLLDVPGAATLVVIFWGLILMVAAAIQYLLMLFRDGAVLILTAVLPIAAAGQFNRGSLLWLPRIVGWLLAFIFVKPAAALIYYLGLSLLGQGKGMQALATAVCIMITATFSLPAMLRLVTFAVDSVPMRSNALAAAATATGMAASATQIAAGSRIRASPAGTGGSTPPPRMPPPGARAPGVAAGAAVAAASRLRAATTRATTPNEPTS